MNPLDLFELNFLFTGSPGTGKTTVAQRMGKLFEAHGLLGSSEVVARSATEMQTGFVGQAGSQTRTILESALGKVLFIDEAYRLNPKVGGTFMKEVLDELVQCLTEPKFKGRLVVILAGYEGDIEDLMTVNPGLKSRFSDKWYFPDFSTSDAAKLLRQNLKKKDLELSAEADKSLPSLIDQLKKAPGWSNGRDIETWSKRIFDEVAVSAMHSKDTGSEVTYDMLFASFEKFIQSKITINQPSFDTTSWPSALPPRREKIPTKVERAIEKKTEVIQKSPPAPLESEKSTNHFSKIDKEFLGALQAAGTELNLNEEEIEKLANSSGIPETLLQKLLQKLSETDPDVIKKKIEEWKIAYQNVLAEKKRAKELKQTPVWRCAVCGRYGCQVAPYIERYDTVST